MSRPFDGDVFDDKVFDVDEVIVVRPQFGGGPLGVGRARAFKAAGIDAGSQRLNCEPGEIRVVGGSAVLRIGHSMPSSPAKGAGIAGGARLCIGRAMRAECGQISVDGAVARLSRAMPDEEEAILQVLLAA